MANFLQALKNLTNKTLTENGAVTYRSTGSQCLDLFASIGAVRTASEKDIITRFQRAYVEDADLAMKILFYARDVRGGLGERRVFRTIFTWLASDQPLSVKKNVAYVADFGRFDDLLTLLGTPCEEEALAVIKEQLAKDMDALAKDMPVSLLGKWLPSINASNEKTVAMAKRIATSLGMDNATYRKTLSALRGATKIVENNLRERKYTFKYSALPSKALFKYRKAFLRNDQSRYQSFLQSVQKDSSLMHTGTLTPYDIIAPIIGSGYHNDSWFNSITPEERRAVDTTWNAQEDFTGNENALVVVDGSGSMYYAATKPVPAAVALSLGIYFAERNKGLFKDYFITFSANPQLVHIQGRDIVEKVRYCEGFNEVANTNLEKTFALILEAAVRDHASQKELPSKLYIISDMEFDACVRDSSATNFENAKQMFAKHGYRLPDVVFWNVNSRNMQQPVKQNERGVALVSGCSPHIFSMLKEGLFNPYAFMMSVLGSERYACIKA